ncbi:MAG: hypothetical protein AB7H80_09870, partial [Candidatus Kapaibacterium sp.]
QQAEEARQQRAQQQNAEQQHAQQQKTQQKGASDPHSTNANTMRRERTYQAPPVVDHPEKKRIRIWPVWVAFLLLTSIIRSIDSKNSASSIQPDRLREVGERHQKIERRGVNSRFIDSLRKVDSTSKPKSYFRKKEDVVYPEFN